VIRGTTSVDAWVFSPARPLFSPRSVGPTASLLGRREEPRAVQVAAGGV